MADDLTMVLKRKHFLEVVDWLREEAPKHGMVPSFGKNSVLMPGGTVIMPSVISETNRVGEQTALRSLLPADQYFIQAVEQRGFTFSAQGLERYLGAPVGTSTFCIKQDGHIETVLKKASDLISKILTLDHCQAQFHMLLYCGSVMLHHLTRLLPPVIMSGFALRYEELILSALQHILSSKSFNYYQKKRALLPENEGGVGLISVSRMLDAAYVAGCGAAAKWFKNSGWEEADLLYSALRSRGTLRNSVAAVNQTLEPHRDKVRMQTIDTDRPELWPEQYKLMAALNRLDADELETEYLDHGLHVEASVFASCRLRYSGAWIRAPSSVQRFRAQSHIFRIMLCMRLGVEMPGSELIQQCACGFSHAPSLQSGIHWVSQCPQSKQRCSRHGAVRRQLRVMMKGLTWRVVQGETACWWPGQPHLRPYDILACPKEQSVWQGYDVGVADPTRIGNLPAHITYFSKGHASARMHSRKLSHYQMQVNTYGQPRAPVQFQPLIFEAMGGFGRSTMQKWKEWAKYAHENAIGGAYRHEEDGFRGAAAVPYTTWHAMCISWLLASHTAISAYNGLHRSAVLAAGAREGGL